MTDRVVRAAAAAAAVLLLAACGVPLQAQPAQIPADVLPAPLPSPSPSASPASSPASSIMRSPAPTPSYLRLWFVREDGLVAAESSVVAGSRPLAVLATLAAGPSAAQEAEGLRTIAVDPLTGQPLVSVLPSAPSPTQWPDPAASMASGDGDVVSVQLSSAFSALPPTEQVLLLGQVVLSLTGAGADAVSFTDEAGTVLAVPLPDGRLLDLPARARDYAPLIVQP